MQDKQQLEFIIRGKVARAVDDYLGGDWSRVQTLFTLPRSQFDAWADSIELPYGRVSRKKDDVNGTYVLQDPDGWRVFQQKNGIWMSEGQAYATYKEAKRAAIAKEFLDVLREQYETSDLQSVAAARLFTNKC